MHEAEETPARVAALVHVVESLRDAVRDGQRRLQRHGPGVARAQQRPDVASVHVLHDEEVLAVDLADVDDVDDVRMVEGRGEPRLGEEHLDERRVLGEVGKDELQHARLLEAGDAEGLREVELGHAAAGEATSEDVAADLGAGGQGAARTRSLGDPLHARIIRMRPGALNPPAARFRPTSGRARVGAYGFFDGAQRPASASGRGIARRAALTDARR